MKKLFLILCVAAFCASCGGDNDDPKPVQKKWDPNAMVLIKPDKSAFSTVATRAENPEHLSALEIVKQGQNLNFYTQYFDNILKDEPFATVRGFSENQKDFETPALKMWGTDIINQEGEFVNDFIQGSDFVVTTYDVIDTIAYIPNAVIEATRDTLKKAYEAKHYEEVYKLFDEAFTFKPITGAEWRSLKAENKQ